MALNFILYTVTLTVEKLNLLSDVTGFRQRLQNYVFCSVQPSHVVARNVL